MNYYNPYYIMNPSSAIYPTISGSGSTGGLLSGLTRRISWSSILNNTQRTLGIVNQAIPLVKQATPMINNAKTMFRIMNEFKKEETPNQTNIQTNSSNESNNVQKEDSVPEKNYYVTNGPTFFQ